MRPTTPPATRRTFRATARPDSAPPVTTAADLLQALRARMPSKRIVDRRTGLPYGWGIWMSNRKHEVARFNDNHVMDVLLARRQPTQDGVGGVSLLSPFQAFRSLWWQHWDPRPKDQRRQHWLAVLGSFLIHLGFIALLIWVVTVRWAPEETKPGDESRVRMTFIGDGAQEQGGGEGQPAAEASTRRLQLRCLRQRRRVHRRRKANQLHRRNRHRHRHRRQQGQLPSWSSAPTRTKHRKMRRNRCKLPANPSPQMLRK